MIEPLELEFSVACPPEHAFEVWTERTSMWWPKGHSVSGEPGLTVTIESREGGRIFERTPEGVEHDWGQVTAWEPPHRLAYLWHIAWDRADATAVEITFSPEGEDGTRVAIVHSGWERFGERAPTMRDRNRAGWASLIDPYGAACVKPAA